MKIEDLNEEGFYFVGHDKKVYQCRKYNGVVWFFHWTGSAWGEMSPIESLEHFNYAASRKLSDELSEKINLT